MKSIKRVMSHGHVVPALLAAAWLLQARIARAEADSFGTGKGRVDCGGRKCHGPRMERFGRRCRGVFGLRQHQQCGKCHGAREEVPRRRAREHGVSDGLHGT